MTYTLGTICARGGSKGVKGKNIKLLANATSLARLSQLGLRKCGLKSREARVLVNSARLTGLKCLELGGNSLSARDRAAITAEG